MRALMPQSSLLCICALFCWSTCQTVLADDYTTEQRRAIERILQLKAKVNSDRNVPGDVIAADFTGTPVTDADLGLFNSLTGISTLSLEKTSITDAGLAQLKDLKDMKILVLTGTRISDEGLRTVGGMVKLTHLSLSVCPKVTDKGLAHLRNLTELETLQLGKTDISDAGIKHLEGMRKLQILGIGATPRITDAVIPDLVALSKLEKLTICGTAITPRGFAQLMTLRSDLASQTDHDFDIGEVQTAIVAMAEKKSKTDENPASKKSDVAEKSDPELVEALKKADRLLKTSKESDDEDVGALAYKKFTELLKSLAPKFPLTKLGDYQATTVNAHGSGVDAIRFRTPKGESAWNMEWEFIEPYGSSMTSWYIVPLTGTMDGFDVFRKVYNVEIEGLKLPESNSKISQELVGGHLKPDSEYLIWFDFENDQPVKMFVRIVLSVSAEAISAEKHRQKALAGDLESQWQLGRCFETGSGVDTDKTVAVEWYLKAAEKGYPPAQFALVKCYGEGVGVKEDIPKAVEWLKKSADQEYGPALLQLGLAYKQGGAVEKDLEKAAELFRRAGDQREKRGTFELASSYLNGAGVKKDPVKGFELLQGLAAQDYDPATFRLADCYRDGRGVTKDPAKTFELMQKLAQKSLPVAQRELALCYERGTGVKPDIDEAFKWMEFAARAQDADAQFYLAMYFVNGSGADQNLGQAAKWMQKAAAQGHSEAQFAMKELKLDALAPKLRQKTAEPR